MPKTITDIIPPSRRRAMGEGEVPVSPAMNDMSVPPPPPPRFSTPKREGSFPFKWLFAALGVIILSVIALFAFGGAKVEATPTAKPATVSASFSATPSAGDLPYQIITAEASVSLSVKAEGTESVDVPAQGTITIFNEQTKTQELINNTRFETSDGLIFRIRESVRVPPGTAEAPGKLEVTAYADVGGDRYNIGPSSFTLPGLRGSAVYEQVYATSETGMKGGFTGTRASVAETTRTAKYEEMRPEIDAGLSEAVLAKIPAGYTLLEGATFIDYIAEPDGEAASDSVALRERGVATAVVFPTEALARAIAFSSLGVYGGQPVTLLSSEGLTYASEGGVRPVAGETMNFTLTGEATVVWIISPDEIRGAIAGKSRDAAKTLLSGFSEIDEARLVLKPFWKGTLPEDPSEIEVVVKGPRVN